MASSLWSKTGRRRRAASKPTLPPEGGGGTIRSSAGSLLLRSFSDGRLSVKRERLAFCSGGETVKCTPLRRSGRSREEPSHGSGHSAPQPQGPGPSSRELRTPEQRVPTQPFPRSLQITGIKPPFSPDLPPFIFH